MKQRKLFSQSKIERKFGGELLLGRRKSSRPISIREPMHLILKSTKILGRDYFSPHDRELHNLIRKAAEKYNVRIFRFSLSWSHIHFLMLFRRRKDYVHFIRYATSRIVSILSRRFGMNLKGLFALRPYSRIVAWGRDFKRMCGYVGVNILESLPALKELSEFCENYWRAGPVV